MLIETIGKDLTKTEVCWNTACILIDKLMPNIRKLDLTIQLTRKNDVEIDPDDDRSFIINLEKDTSIPDLIRNLCHEMVHVKQYVLKEINDKNGFNNTYWKGEKVDKEIDYWALPWEVEAYNMEDQLLDFCYKKWYNDS